MQNIILTMGRAFKAYAPATLSNLGSGFDLLGMAIQGMGDHVIARESTSSDVIITKISGHSEGISKTNNTAMEAVKAFQRDLEVQKGVELEVQKGYAHSSGLGSSAASAVAAVVATNALWGRPVKQKEDLFSYAYAGELSQNHELPSDNIAASLYGGIVLSHGHETPKRLPSIPGLTVAIVRQPQAVSTIEGRNVLNPTVPINSFVEQTHAIASLILGLYRSDLDLLQVGLTDHVVESQRKIYIPHFDTIQQRAIQYEALGCSISGSGPSIFAIFQNNLGAEKFINDINVLHPEYFTHIGAIDEEGACVC